MGEPLKRNVRRLQMYATVGLHVAHSVRVNVCGVLIFNRICRGYDSGRPIEVRYTIKCEAGVLSSTDAPVKIAASEATNRYRSQWRSLTPTQYQIIHTENAITITVQVMPQEALWVTSMFHYIGDDDPNDVASWPLDEITIRGAQGGMSFTGDKSRKAFEYVSRVLYSITYK